MSLLPRASAALRHWILSTAILCAALVPVLQLVVPAWSIAPAPARGSDGVAATAPTSPAPVAPTATTTIELPLPAGDGERRSSESPSLWISGFVQRTWMAGAAVCALALLAGLLRLAWLASRSTQVVTGPWPELAAEVSRLYGIRRPVRLLHSAHPAMLVTWGIARPKVILPAGALGWSPDRIRIVLCHELAHIQRGDWLGQLAAEALRSVFWFNPIVWLASTRLRRESEHACDDVVLGRGVGGAEYADHLVYLARALNARRVAWYPAPAMARPSSLERRVSAMLNDRLNRTPMSGAARAAIAACLVALTVPIAGFAAQSFASFSGIVADQTGGLVPKVSLVLTHVQTNSKQTVESNGAGAFEFVGLRAGEYVLEAKSMGFATLRNEMTLSAGQTVHRTITLQVGSLEETITLVHSDKEKPRASGARRSVQRADRGATATKPCTPASVGGQIRPPTKITDVRPVYPEALRGTGIAGLVTLQARIGPDGTVPEVQVVNAAHPDLGSAAVEAVRQWQFTPTLLNCVPIDVNMAVSVSFRVEP